MFGVVKLNGFNKAAHNGQYSSDPYDPPFLVPIASQKYTNFNVLSLKRYIKSFIIFYSGFKGLWTAWFAWFPEHNRRCEREKASYVRVISWLSNAIRFHFLSLFLPQLSLFHTHTPTVRNTILNTEWRDPRSLCKRSKVQHQWVKLFLDHVFST